MRNYYSTYDWILMKAFFILVDGLHTYKIYTNKYLNMVNSQKYTLNAFNF